MRREALLDAAEELLDEQGAQGLTLAAVAERAGVSKGGLLYHFASKQSLISGMIERLIAEFDALVEAQRQDTYTKAYLDATIAAITAGRLKRWAVVTGASGDPHLLAPLREAMERWHSQGIGAELDPEASRVVRLACGGLWEIAAHCPGVSTDHDALRRRLLALL
ncbi:TetR family transcriptional regulator [Streptosporangiaceae bacterium NEAU-GS5]|nr:TetR family transcriptional regulator [Streptosporangiaceae bacterium NEAU-GS5]